MLGIVGRGFFARGARTASSSYLYMVAMLAALYLNYYFMGVVIEIGALRSIIVFVPL